MNSEVWIAYIIATTLILMIPGPTIILVISQAVTHGRKSVVPLVAGVVLGDFTAMTLSLLGLGAVTNLRQSRRLEFMNRSKRIKYWVASKATYWRLAIYQKDRADPDADLLFPDF